MDTTFLKRREPQAGFTLAEVVVSLLIFVIILFGASRFLTALRQTGSAALEANELTERARVVKDLLTDDVGLLGKGLPTQSVLNTGVQPGVFVADSNYQVSSDSNFGSLTKTGPTGALNQVTLSRSIMSGGGSISFIPSSSATVTIFNPNSAVSMGFRFSSGTNGTITVSVIENGSDAPAGSIGFVAGDSYRISIEVGPNGNRVVRYYRTDNGSESLIYTSALSPPPFPVRIGAILPVQGTSLTGIQLSASVSSTATLGLGQYPLPLDLANGQRFVAPISISTAKVDFLSVDQNVDRVHTVSDFSSTGSLHTEIPARGSFATADYILLVDTNPVSPTSGVFQIASISSSVGSLTLGVTPMTGSSSNLAAWGRFYSSPVDLAHLFPVGSYVVKIAPVVTYQIVGTRLVRSETSPVGVRNTTAAVGVSSFSVSDASTSSVRSYQVSLGLTTEGIASVGATEVYKFTLSPGGLNSAGDYIFAGK